MTDREGIYCTEKADESCIFIRKPFWNYASIGRTGPPFWINAGGSIHADMVVFLAPKELAKW